MKFADTIGFYRYAREMGAEGVQSALRSKDVAVAKKLRGLVEGVIPAQPATRLIDLCWRFATLDDASQLPRAAAA